MKKLCIFGSRTLFKKEVIKVISDYIDAFSPKIIITAAEPMGVCKIARDLAKTKCIPITLYYLNKEKFAAGQYEKRGRAALADADFCLFVWDGKSKGTSNEIQDCIKMGVEHEIIKINC